METEKYHINAWVTIRKNKVIRNGKIFLEKNNVDAAVFLKDIYQELKAVYPKFYKMDRLCKLAFVATELLLKGHHINCQPDEVALVFSNASASLDTDTTYYSAIEDKSNYFPSPAVFVYTLPNIMMGEVCIRHQFLGENTFFISEKFDGALLADAAQNMLDSGKAKSVIAGWIEISGNDMEAAVYLIDPSGKGTVPLSMSALESLFHLTGT